MIKQSQIEESDPQTRLVNYPANETRSRFLETLNIAAMLLIVFLLPILRFNLPFNMALVDICILIALPIFWLYLVSIRQIVHLPYLVAMLFILLGSFLGTLGALYPIKSFFVVLKEIYLYCWFITMVALFSGFKSSHWRLLLIIWLATVTLQGILLIAQFLSPNLLRSMSMNISDFAFSGSKRPIGLTQNPNMAASFQITGFVPLLLLSLDRKVALTLGIILSFSILATGSLSAIGAFLCGLSFIYIILPIMTRRLGVLIKVFALLVISALFLGGLFYFVINSYPEYLDRITYITFDRFQDSFTRRFTLWQQAEFVIPIEKFILGVGPGNFKYMTDIGKSAHNDLFSFFFERGILGALGLVLLGGFALYKSICTLLKYRKHPPKNWYALIMLATIIMLLIQSQTHQIFHFRFVWLLLAVQEAAAIGSLDLNNRKI